MVVPWSTSDSPRMTPGLMSPSCQRPKGREVANPATGEVIWTPHSWRDALGQKHYLRCESNDCAACRATNVHRIAGAIALAAPTHSLSLTHVGDSPSVIIRRLSNFRAHVAEVVPGYQHVWAAEENPRQTVIHTHGYVHTGARAREIPRHVVTKAARRAGLGWINKIEPIDPDASIEWFKYPMECALDPDRVDRFWALNSAGTRRRLIHASRAFWRDGPHGEPISREEAEKLAYWRSRSSLGDPNVHLLSEENP